MSFITKEIIGGEKMENVCIHFIKMQIVLDAADHTREGLEKSDPGPSLRTSLELHQPTHTNLRNIHTLSWLTHIRVKSTNM